MGLALGRCREAQNSTPGVVLDVSGDRDEDQAISALHARDLVPQGTLDLPIRAWRDAHGVPGALHASLSYINWHKRRRALQMSTEAKGDPARARKRLPEPLGGLAGRS